MKKQVLFIQGGGGEEDYNADKKLVDSLSEALGEDYVMHYPQLSAEEEPDFGRKSQISRELSLLNGEVILVGHSLGASMLLKCLSETRIERTILGVFLISTPFWSGNEDWKRGFILRKDFAENLPENVPFYFYHCRDDEEVPFNHLDLYAEHLPEATARIIDSGGHQINNDLSAVSKDIKLL